LKVDKRILDFGFWILDFGLKKGVIEEEIHHWIWD